MKPIDYILVVVILALVVGFVFDIATTLMYWILFIGFFALIFRAGSGGGTKNN